MKTKVKLSSFLLAVIMIASIFGGFGASAATSSFTATKENFRAVFDFDTIPGTYTNGDTTVGTRTDTVGDSKSEKCVDAQGIGLTYTLAIDNSNSVKGNALKLTVTDLAPEEGAYCPISFNVKYGPNKLVDVSGATDFMFWCDTTNFKDGYTNQKGIILYIQESNVLPDGSVSTDAATAWKPKKGSDGGFYYYEDGKGGWAKQATNDTDFYLPVNYRGWIRMPMSAFDYCDWNDENVNDHFYGKQIQVVQFGMGNYARQKGSVIYFDEMGFTGEFKEESDNNNSSSSVQSNSSSQNSSSSQNQNSSSETQSSEVSDSSSEINSSETVSDNEISSEVSVSDKEQETEESGGSLTWLWIVIGAVAVIIIALLCFYFLYLKKHPDFFKKNTDEKQ